MYEVDAIVGLGLFRLAGTSIVLLGTEPYSYTYFCSGRTVAINPGERGTLDYPYLATHREVIASFGNNREGVIIPLDRVGVVKVKN